MSDESDRLGCTQSGRGCAPRWGKLPGEDLFARYEEMPGEVCDTVTQTPGPRCPPGRPVQIWTDVGQGDHQGQTQSPYSTALPQATGVLWAENSAECGGSFGANTSKPSVHRCPPGRPPGRPPGASPLPVQHGESTIPTVGQGQRNTALCQPLRSDPIGSPLNGHLPPGLPTHQGNTEGRSQAILGAPRGILYWEGGWVDHRPWPCSAPHGATPLSLSHT